MSTTEIRNEGMRIGGRWFPLKKLCPCITPIPMRSSERFPLTALTLADILYEAWLPPEMFQVVTGWRHDIGDEMISNENIDIIAFTGGVPVGN